MARTRAKARRAAHLAAVATGPLGALSHDEVGVVFEALAEPLEPHVAVALASTCHGLRAPTAAALAELRRRHEAVKALCAKEEHSTRWTEVRDAEDVTSGANCAAATVVGKRLAEKALAKGLRGANVADEAEQILRKGLKGT